VMAGIIRSAAVSPTNPPTEKQIGPYLEIIIDELANRHGVNVGFLANPELGVDDKAGACELSYDLYQTILRQPPGRSGPILRHMFGSR
jgi:hypothetical protein